MTTKARIEITADDRTRAAFESVKRNVAGMQSSAAAFTRVFAGLGGVLSVGAFTAFAKTAISSAAALDDMAESTGATVDGLSKLTDIARVGGQDIGQVETALVRLNKALSGSDDESKGAAAAIKALGLDFQRLQQQSPDQALEDVAKSFAKFEDGAGKTSVALALFGKSGAQLLPLLKDIAEQSERVASLTGEQAAQAERLEKNFNALSVSASNYARSLVTDLVPALNQFFEVANKAGAGGALDATIGYKLRKTLGVGEENIQSEISKAQDKLDEMIESREKSITPFGRSTETDIGNQRNYIAGLKEIARLEAMSGAGAPYGNEARKPQLPFITPPDTAKKAKAARAAGKEEDPFKAQREAIEAIGKQSEAAAEAEEAVARLGQRYRELYDPSAAAIAKFREFEEIRPILQGLGLDVEAIADVLREDIGNAEFGDKLKDIADLAPKTEDAADAARELGLTFSSAFEDAIVGGKELSDVLRGLAQDILKIVARKTITEPIATFVSGALGEIFKGFRASGGPVFPGGAYVVGERGPELFVPPSAGNIVPNGAGGGVSVTLNVATGVQSTVRAELLNLLPQLQRATVAAVADARMRGAAV